MSGQHRLGLAHARVPRVSRLAFTVLLAIPLALLALAPLSGRAAAHPTAPHVPACCVYYGPNLPLSSMRFHSLLSATGTPNRLATDDQGNLYVSDTSLDQVLMYDANDNFVRSFGTGTTSANPGDFNHPAGVAAYSNSVFVADQGNHRIQVFNQSTGAYVTEFGDSHLSTPDGMALGGNGELYVSDITANQVAIFDRAGDFIKSFGSAGTGNGQFQAPLGVAASPDLSIWVCDYSNDRMEEFNLSGTYITQFSTLTGPLGAAVDRAGRVHVVQASGYIDNYFSPVLGQFVPGNLSTPTDIAVTSVPNTPISVYVADSNAINPGYGTVQRFDLVVQPQAHNYQAQWGSNGSGNGQLNGPWDTVVDSAGNVYVSDYGNNRVQKFDQFGHFLLAFGGAGSGNGQFNGPMGLAVNPTDNSVYVVDNGNDRIEQFSASGTYLTQWGGPGPGNGQFNNPRAVATDGNSVYVADTYNNRVQVFSTSGTYQFQFGTAGTGNGQFAHPAGIAIDGRTEELYVADTNNNRVEVFSSIGIYLTAFTSVTELDIQLDEPVTQNFSSPQGLAVDGRGDLYIADAGNDTIDQIILTYPVPVGSTWGDWYGSAGSGNGQFSFPPGMAVSPTNGQIYVADAFNNRIQRLGSPWAKNDTIGVYRPSSQTFFLRNENSTGPADIVVYMPYALPGDLPVVGDWEGTGVDTVGLYRPSTGNFLLQERNVSETEPDYTFTLGINGDTPIAGDWTGDGKFGAGVFRPSNGILYTRDTLSTGYADNNMVMGINGDHGVAGDWNGDGQDSPGVYRPSNQTYYVTNKVTNGVVFSDATATLGIPGDVPFTGDWQFGNGGFASGIGVFRPSNGITYEKNAISTGYADNSFVYGIAGDIPVAGQWVPTFIQLSPHIPSHHPAGGSAPKAPAKGHGSTHTPKPAVMPTPRKPAMR